jgi:hypothetical protein
MTRNEIKTTLDELGFDYMDDRAGRFTLDGANIWKIDGEWYWTECGCPAPCDCIADLDCEPVMTHELQMAASYMVR